MHTTATQSSVVHSTFSIERTYPVPPSRVFSAFANRAAKRRWFAEGEGWEVEEFTSDFRVGAASSRASASRVVLRFATRRFTRTSCLTGASCSRTRWRSTTSASPSPWLPWRSGHQARAPVLSTPSRGAFFDGADKPEGREAGCRELLEKLGEELRKQ
jgi:hypothetical protein